MRKLLGKLRCWITRKHKRGKLVRQVGNVKMFSCPRCGREKQYTVKAQE